MISLTIQGPIATVTLARPPVNAINEEWVAALGAKLDEVERAAGVGVLRIRSEARVFCAGADLELMRALFDDPAGRSRMIDLTRGMQEVFARIERLDQVSIAEIGGAALGGGLELALACDLRLAAESARIGLPEARLGLLPAAGGTQRLTRICGDALARRLILGAEVIAGSAKQELGLVHWVIPDAELEAAAGALAGRLADVPRLALAEAKRCIAAALDRSRNGFELELAASARLLASGDAQARVRRFLDKQAAPVAG